MTWYENPTLRYPQLPPLANEELKAFLKQPLIAKLATHNEDGSIHLAPLWFQHADGEILLGTQAITQKVRNIERDENVTVLIDIGSAPFKGVMIYGKASLDYNDVIQKRIAIFENYISTEDARNAIHGIANRWTPVIVRVKPERIISFDYAKG